MPALQLFGRRWLIAGDDVPLPAAFLALFHFVSMQVDTLKICLYEIVQQLVDGGNDCDVCLHDDMMV